VQLFSNASPSVLGFVSRLRIGSTKPHFPTIFGTGFFIDSSGIAATNRHVTEAFSKFPPNPKTGESSLAARKLIPGLLAKEFDHQDAIKRQSTNSVR
jgi:S1-C subfamily serine protease